MCREANVSSFDADPKGAVISFRHEKFSNPEGLVKWIGEQGTLAKLRPDMKILLTSGYVGENPVMKDDRFPLHVGDLCQRRHQLLPFSTCLS